jgi:hypothetical protein
MPPPTPPSLERSRPARTSDLAARSGPALTQP